MTTATAQIRADLWNNRLQQALAGSYLFIWILTGISPLDRRDWLLENFVVVLFIGLLVSTYRRFPLTPLATIPSDLTIVSLFSALGLTLSAMVVSCVSSETISMMLNFLG